jgi:hypothetical protein
MIQTLDNRVKIAMRGVRPGATLTAEDVDALYGFIEAEIVDAMKEAKKEGINVEREACAMIADEEAGHHAGEMERLKRNDLATVIEEKAMRTSKEIASRIRARS